ncbi:MAG: glycosyltransferase family 39 protein [Filimonas sp.]|nr:glycosyltransferase family 39 protein [Filimonas sp.]
MYKKKLINLIVVVTIIRLITACILELGNDEVYYYTYALHLQSNYFDHPPGIAWLIKLFTLNLTFQSEVFIRLGSIVFAAIGTWLVYQMGTFIRNERTGWFAAILYNTSIYTSIIAGTFILPDSPQVVFWLASVYAALHIVKHSTADEKVPFKLWLLFGLMNGLCIMCKVHGIFLWLGFGAYILLFDRKLFRSPGLYIAGIVTLLIISPIFWWNIQNGFVTWNYHSERVEVRQFSINTDDFIQTLIGQLFYNSPINVTLSVIALIYLFRHTAILKSKYLLLLIFCGLPIVLVVTVISLFKPVLPHWSGPGFLTLSLLAAYVLDVKAEAKNRKATPAILKVCNGFILVLVAVAIIGIKFYPGTLGSKDEQNLGELDFTLDLNGWREFNHEFTRWADSAKATGFIHDGTKIVCNKWFPAAHIEYYTARRNNLPVTGVGYVNDLHQYVWLNHLRPQLQIGENALCIVPSNVPETPAETYKTTFASTDSLRSFTQYRSGHAVRHFTIYLLKGYNGSDEARRFKIK